MLISQLRHAQTQFENYTPQQVAAITYNTGTYVEFSGAENCDLITKSLEVSNQGIKLLNIRDVVIDDTVDFTKTTTKATVFIPKGKEDVFIRKILAFAEEETKKGNPKNNDFVSSIESISSALKISAFWVGRSSEMPGDTYKWYELWVDVIEEEFQATLNNTYDILDNLNIAYNKHEYIRFPERLVLSIWANRTTLLDLIKQGVTIAEIRKPADPNTYFLDTNLQEQDEWAQDLLSRTVFNDNEISVCILDTGVNNNHPLIAPYMNNNGMTVNGSWGIADGNGHGTNMAGIVLYNDLRESLLSKNNIQINHTVESVKILGNSATKSTLYGAVTEQAALMLEISSPSTKRIYCMAITDEESGTNDGQPSSWSAAIDKIAAEGEKKLFIVSSGNVEYSKIGDNTYPDCCLCKSVEDPAQSWNALTVGAYTIDSSLQDNNNLKGYKAIAQIGELSPYSSTSNSWKSQWPLKPEIVCDGGNVATDGVNFIEGHDDLSKLTLHKDINNRLFDTIYATSAATAQCSYIAAEILSVYPSISFETLRALIVHSARWTEQMKQQFGLPDKKTQGRRKLLRTCGYGVPNLALAKDTLNNRVNMIIEGELQPYEKIKGSNPKMKEMHVHSIPWPESVLREMENTAVKVRITLSYFIEPGPGQKGWKNKYRYASCGLRFDLKRPNESIDEFQKRINNAMREDEYQSTNSSDNNWYLGAQNRDVGSIHSDVWEDTAINLSESNRIAIYPVIGWWRERTSLKKYNSKIKYSLIVTIETPSEENDIYTPIMTKIASRVAIPVALESNS